MLLAKEDDFSNMLLRQSINVSNFKTLVSNKGILRAPSLAELVNGNHLLYFKYTPTPRGGTCLKSLSLMHKLCHLK